MNLQYFLIGLPGSGKTTWTKEFIKENPNTIVISRDAFREAIMPNHRETWYQREDRQWLEHIVTRLCEELHWTQFDYTQIIDETNCNPAFFKKHLKKLEKIGLLQFVRFVIFNTPLKVCQNRFYRRDYPEQVNSNNMATGYFNKPEVAFIAGMEGGFNQVVELITTKYPYLIHQKV